MLLGEKQNFLGLFITAIRSDRCSVAAFYPAVTWPPLFPNEPPVIPNPVSMVDSGVASHLGPWLPGVMILPLPGCDSVMECSSHVCVCYLLCVCSSLVCVFISFVCVHPFCVSMPCVSISCVCVCSSLVCVHLLCGYLPLVCSSPVCIFIPCVFIPCVCVHLLCVCSSPICVFISYVCVIPFVYSSPVCVHTHIWALPQIQAKFLS